MRFLNKFLKAFFDFFAALLGLTLISPLLLIIAVSIKLTSKGSVFFLQERLGKNGKPFKIIKFRTMVVGAEKIGDGLKVTSEKDVRITKVGRLLRQYSLDELPQLFNVLVGHMSLVGPRPPVTYFPYNGYDNYPDWAKKRFSMRPGITGLAQVSVRNSVSWDERIQIDNVYIDRFNIWMDLKIILMTVLKVFNEKDLYLKADKTGQQPQVLVPQEKEKEEVLK